MHDVRQHSKKQRPFHRYQMHSIHLSYAFLLSSHMTVTCEGSCTKATCNHKTTVLFIATLSLLKGGCIQPLLAACVDSWELLCICGRDSVSSSVTHLINHSLSISINPLPPRICESCCFWAALLSADWPVSFKSNWFNISQRLPECLLYATTVVYW